MKVALTNWQNALIVRPRRSTRGKANSRISEDNFELLPELDEERATLLARIVGVHQANGDGVRPRGRIVEWAAAFETRVEVVHPDGA